MFDGYGSFPAYVPVARRRRQAERKVAALAKKGVKVSPVVIEGRAISRTFWGRAWCDSLETFSDYSNRLPRGRTYVRNGSVIHLELSEGKVSALVSGSSVYEVEATIRPLPPERWKAIVQQCVGRIGSVVELLTGKLSGGVMEVLSRKGEGLLPGPREISLQCSCPDGAFLCKHLAAVLYGVGARLDHEPELLFVLRGVDKDELLSRAVEGGALVKDQAGPNALSRDDLSGLFGIELDPGDPSEPVPPPAEATPPGKRRRIPGTGRRRRSAARALRQDPARVTTRELLARGLRRSTIRRWLEKRLLLATAERGAYLKTRETEARIEKYLRTRR